MSKSERARSQPEGAQRKAPDRGSDGDYYHVACQDIKDGKVSPWLILNCKTGKEMLSKMNDEQLQIVYHVINPNHWAMRFKRGVADVELVKEVAKEAGI